MVNCRGISGPSLFQALLPNLKILQLRGLETLTDVVVLNPYIIVADLVR